MDFLKIKAAQVMIKTSDNNHVFPVLLKNVLISLFSDDVEWLERGKWAKKNTTQGSTSMFIKALEVYGYVY